MDWDCGTCAWRAVLYHSRPHLVLPSVLTPRGISEDILLCRLEHSFTAQPELVQLDISFPISQIPATDESGDACNPFSPCKHTRLTVIRIVPVHRVSGSWCSCQREHTILLLFGIKGRAARKTGTGECDRPNRVHHLASNGRLQEVCMFMHSFNHLAIG